MAERKKHAVALKKKEKAHAKALQACHATTASAPSHALHVLHPPQLGLGSSSSTPPSSFREPRSDAAPDADADASTAVDGSCGNGGGDAGGNASGGGSDGSVSRLASLESEIAALRQDRQKRDLRDARAAEQQQLQHERMVEEERERAAALLVRKDEECTRLMQEKENECAVIAGRTIMEERKKHAAALKKIEMEMSGRSRGRSSGSGSAANGHKAHRTAAHHHGR